MGTYIVAEIGQNHNGDVYSAVRLAGAAYKAGADAVKFQYRNCELEYTPDVLDAPHPNPVNAFGITYREHRKALDLSLDDLRHIKRRIEYNRWPLDVFATPCHASLVEPLDGALDPPQIKIASKDTHDLALIDAAARTGKLVILSSGMSDLEELRLAVAQVRTHHDRVAVLQCTSLYPAPAEMMELLAIPQLKRELGCMVGLSDHSGTVDAVAPAVALGAEIVEVHITFSKQAKGTDHACSLEPDELCEYVRRVRRTEVMLGTGRKEVSEGVRQSDKWARLTA